MTVQGPFPCEPNAETWQGDVSEWQATAAYIRRSYPGITLFQTKVLYVTGMMRHLLEAAGHAMCDRAFLFPAYLLACGAVELLGHCTMDYDECRRFQRPLRRGLESMIATCSHCGEGSIHGAYSKESWREDEEHIVLTVGKRAYSIGYCKDLRNYTAHGMARPEARIHFTTEFLGRFMAKACEAIDRYYALLRTDAPDGSEMRQRLVTTRISPIWDANGPIHIRDLHEPLLRPPFGTPCGLLLYEELWRR